MDCEACTDRLVDLLYGELEEPDAESTRAHLADCEACAGALARLEKGRELASLMVVEEPPSAVRISVMAAARERAAQRAPAKVAEPPRQPAEPREARGPRGGDDDGGGLWSSFLRWLGGFAMGPQVAMAMMLLLMVGIGLWYLPGLRSRDPGGPHAILDPAPGDEVGPSAGLEPAAPLDLEADPRTGRIRPREEEPARPTPRPAQPRPEPAPERVAAREAADEDREPAQAEAVEREELAQGGPARATRPRATEGATPAEPQDSPEEAAPLELAVGPAQAPRVMEQRAEAQLAQAQAAPAYAAGAGAQALAPSPSPSPARSAMPAPSAPRAQAMDEVAPPPSAADSRHALAQAAHRQAASLREGRNCRAAIPAYQRLLSQNPTYAQAHVARLELADCYRQVGNYPMARQILEQSTRDARVASQAQRELVRLEAAERAMDRTAQTERTPDPPAARSQQHDEAAAESGD